MSFNHIPVLLDETITGLNIKSDGIYLDCTLGGGGHSYEILKRLDTGMLIGLDQDRDAIEYATDRLSEFGDKFKAVHSNFENAVDILKELEVGKVDGVLMDIGVSSYQIDQGSRGFSYRMNAPLDMRMDNRSRFSASYVINQYTKEELEDIFWKYGEEKWGRRIAEFIVEERTIKPIETTMDLVGIIDRAVPASVRSKGGHPAKRIFQAVRIEVNKELDVLSATIPEIVKMIKPGGRIAIITFHSLEDRIVKNIFRELNTGCICPSDFPVCVCNHTRSLKLINRKPIVATNKELRHNPRAKSAKLRIAERV